MGKKIRKIGRRGRKNKRITKIIIKDNVLRSSDPIIRFRFSNGFQGVKHIGELNNLEEITLNKKVHNKLIKKEGHLTIEDIRDILDSPDGIYKKPENTETWFFVKNESHAKRVVVIIEKQGKSHRVATAYIMSLKEFEKKTKNMILIWEQ